MENLKRIQLVTAHYNSMQGLRILPWYLWILLLGAINPILGSPQGKLDYQLLIAVPGFVAPWLLSRWIGNYYDRVFGRVEKMPQPDARRKALGIVLFGVSVYVGYFVDSFQWLPVSVSGLVLAAFFFLWWLSDRFLTHYLVMAAFFVGISLLPLAGIPAGGHWTLLLGGFAPAIVYGLSMSVFCVLDHFVLVHSLNSLSQVGS